MKKTLIALLFSSLATVASGQVDSESKTDISAAPVLSTMPSVDVPRPELEGGPELAHDAEQAPNNYTAMPAANEASDLAAVARFGAEFWFNPRHGDTVMQSPQLRSVVRTLWEMPEAFLVVSYPQGESGELWGLEMQAWLVSLGISSDRVELSASAELLESVVISLATEVAAPSMVEPPESLADEVAIDAAPGDKTQSQTSTQAESVVDDLASDEAAPEGSLPKIDSSEILEVPKEIPEETLEEITE